MTADTAEPRSASPHVSEPRVRVLFLCLGNICRSPMAEGVFRAAVETAGLADAIHIDSAGLGSWHAGDPPDPRAQAAAKQRGYDIAHQRARQIAPVDLERFDLVLAMDNDNLRRLAAVGAGRAEVRLFLEFARAADGEEVPDPYYGGDAGFEDVLDIVQRACQGLLDSLSG